MTTLVTGATGFLGNHLVRTLLARGESVRVLVRSAAKARPLVEQGADFKVGDVTDGDAVNRAMRDVDVIYHLAGRLFVPGVPVSEYQRTHVVGTHLLLACCVERPGFRRFVHVSTTGVVGVTGPRPTAENHPARPTNAYEQSKWQAEKIVRREIARGFPAVIVRPGLVYGPGDLHLLGFFRAIQRGWFRPIGTQPVWLHPIYVDDLVEALLSCANHPLASGRCFNVANPGSVTLGSLAATIASALGVDLPRGTLALPLAHAIALAGDLLPARLKRFAPLTTSRLDFLTNSRVYDVSRIRQLLSFEAASELSWGIAQTVAWYRDRGYLPTDRAHFSVGANSVGLR